MLSHVHFVGLPVTDQDRALAFFADKFGFAVHTDAPYRDGERWIMLKIPGGQTLVHFTPRENEEPGNVPALPFVSDDIQADYERLTAAGVECLDPPQAAPWNASVHYFLCRDSENNMLLVQTIGSD
ncbi:MAG: VOC family protein [Bauldia sp.]|nr:VOC family protein [Bauldia sp.]